jgi:hypothetical protein
LEVKNSVKVIDIKNWCMLFVVRIRLVVVTAGKGRRRNGIDFSLCSFSNDITQFLLTFVKPYKKQFLAAVVQEGDAKEN